MLNDKNLCKPKNDIKTKIFRKTCVMYYYFLLLLLQKFHALCIDLLKDTNVND